MVGKFHKPSIRRDLTPYSYRRILAQISVSNSLRQSRINEEQSERNITTDIIRARKRCGLNLPLTTALRTLDPSFSVSSSFRLECGVLLSVMVGNDFGRTTNENIDNIFNLIL